ncbi:MAG: radical SAM protein [Thermotogaceae bacterium]|nr:radical SAM protein [Thermotogaceae bacterium]
MREPPSIVEYEITTACNSRCIHCYCSAGEKHPNELSLDEIKDLILQVKETKVWALDIVGGEPLIHPRIIDVLAFAREVGQRVMINTNGSLATEEMVKKMKEANPDVLVGVSLDGPDPETNDFIRGKGSFERAISGMKNFIREGFKVTILNVINAVNWRKFEDLVKLSLSLNASSVYVDRFVPVGRGKLNAHILDMSDDEWVEAIGYVRNIVEKYSNRIVFYVEDSIDGEPCSAGITHASILVDGTVVPCGHFRYERRFYMGNIREKSFKEIWESLEPRKFFPVPEECKECPFYGAEDCEGGCKAISYFRYGGTDKADKIICRLRRGNRG